MKIELKQRYLYSFFILYELIRRSTIKDISNESVSGKKYLCQPIESGFNKTKANIKRVW